MATVTSTTSGNWASGGTWVGGVAPVDGDRVVIANTHVVTVAANTAIGDEPASNTAVITCNGNGSLTLSSGVELVVRGGISLVNGALTLGAGSSLAITPPASAPTYVITLGTYASSSSLVANGTSGSRCKIYRANANGIDYVCFWSL